jgi:hypothetical protein
MRRALQAYANLRPAVVLPQLVDASTLKPEVVTGVDIMIVRELVGGIYFGEPRVSFTWLFVSCERGLIMGKHWIVAHTLRLSSSQLLMMGHTVLARDSYCIPMIDPVQSMSLNVKCC